MKSGKDPDPAHQELRRPETTHPDGNGVHTPEVEGAPKVKGQEPREAETMTAVQLSKTQSATKSSELQ